MGTCARGAMKKVNRAELSSPARSPAHHGEARLMGLRTGGKGQLAGGLLRGPWEGTGGAAWGGGGAAEGTAGGGVVLVTAFPAAAVRPPT